MLVMPSHSYLLQNAHAISPGRQISRRNDQQRRRWETYRPALWTGSLHNRTRRNSAPGCTTASSRQSACPAHVETLQHPPRCCLRESVVSARPGAPRSPQAAACWRGAALNSLCRAGLAGTRESALWPQRARGCLHWELGSRSRGRLGRSRGMAASTEPCLLRQPARSGVMSAAQLCGTAWAACRSACTLTSEAWQRDILQGIAQLAGKRSGVASDHERSRGMCSMLATASHLPGEDPYSGTLFAAFAEVV